MINKFNEAYGLLSNARGKVNSRVDAKLRFLNDELKKSTKYVQNLKRLNKCHLLADNYKTFEDSICEQALPIAGGL